MNMIDSDNYYLDGYLSMGSEYEFVGISNFADWDINMDFFDRVDDNTIKFTAYSGNYKVTANFEYEYLKIEPITSSGDYATLSDGGAVWLIGDDNAAKPTLSNAYSWNTEDGPLALARTSENTYQISFTAGVSINASSFDFKFFHQKGWGGEFGEGTITTSSNLIQVTSSGNIQLADSQSLEVGGIYTFTLDISGGTSAAVVTVEKVGGVEIPTAGLTIDGTSMTMVDTDNYTLDISLTQGTAIVFGGSDSFTPEWINPDFFDIDYKLLPLSGWYRVTANLSTKVIDALAITGDGGDLKTLDDNGNGAIYLLGWGFGSPSLANEVGWTTENGICVPEYSDKIYKMRVTAGVQGSSTLGERIRYDYISGKFFAERGWGGLGTFTLENDGTDSFLKVADGGNLELADGVTLVDGADYQITVDCTAGKNSPVVSFKKIE